jgi:Putative adhesin
MQWNVCHRIILPFGLLSLAQLPAPAAESPLFQRTLSVSLKDPVTLDVAIGKGDLTIAYSLEGQVSVYAFAKDDAGNYVPKDLVKTLLSIEQEENHITIRDASRVPPPEAATVSYRIDVPMHTQLASVISESGKQVIVGITGPANVVSGSGDIEATWIRFGLFKASTGKGKITCTRVTPGMIEIGGARGVVKASTDKGEIHVKAVNWDDWQLTSVSGNIRVEVPTEAKFQAELSTGSGEISVWRSDMKEPEEGTRQLLQTVNGGGKRIQALSTSGDISIE